MCVKLSTKSGESGIGIILFVAMVIVFIILPIFTIVFEKSLLFVAYQDISDTLEMGTFKVFQKILIDDLSMGKVNFEDTFKEEINEYISSCFVHPQIDYIEIKEIIVKKNEYYGLSFVVYMKLNPTLYRSFWNIDEEHEFTYNVVVPLDKKE